MSDKKRSPLTYVFFVITALFVAYVAIMIVPSIVYGWFHMM